MRFQLRKRQTGGAEDVIQIGVKIREIQHLAVQTHGMGEAKHDLHVRQFVVGGNGTGKVEDMVVQPQHHLVALHGGACGQNVIRPVAGFIPEKIRYHEKLHLFQRFQHLFRLRPHLGIDAEGDQRTEGIGLSGQDRFGKVDALRLVDKRVPDGPSAPGEGVLDPRRSGEVLVVIVQICLFRGGSAVPAGAVKAPGEGGEHRHGTLVLHAVDAVDDGAAGDLDGEPAAGDHTRGSADIRRGNAADRLSALR